jgi:hypothetical protein
MYVKYFIIVLGHLTMTSSGNNVKANFFILILNSLHLCIKSVMAQDNPFKEYSYFSD